MHKHKQPLSGELLRETHEAMHASRKPAMQAFKTSKPKLSFAALALSQLIAGQLCFVSCYLQPMQADASQNSIEVEILDQAGLTAKLDAANQVEVVRESALGGSSHLSSHWRQLDACAADLLAFGHRSSPYPMTENELATVFCPNHNRTVACIKSSSLSLNKFERQVLEWVLSSTRRMNNKRCKNGNDKQKFLKLTNFCFSQMDMLYDRCMDSYIVSLEAIAALSKYIPKLSENDYQIQLACCANTKFKQCVMENAESHCLRSEFRQSRWLKKNRFKSDKTARKLMRRAKNGMMNEMESMLDLMALTGPELICRSVKKSFCANKFDGKYDINSRRPTYKSIVPAMLKIYAS